MKKLYVLLFLIMFMGKMFSSSTNQESFKVPQTPAELEAFAIETGLTESDLKVPVFTKSDKTSDKKFILNLQKQIIIKLTSQLNETADVSKLLKILSLSNDSLPVGIRKTPDDLQKDLSAALTKSKVKLPMPVQKQIYGFSLNPQYKPYINQLTELAIENGFQESDLKSMGIINWVRESILRGKPLTPDQRFALRLQEAIIKKISDKSTAPDKIEGLLKALSLSNKISLPVGIGKTTQALLNSVSLSLPVSDPKLSDPKRKIFEAFRKQMYEDSDSSVAVPQKNQFTIQPVRSSLARTVTSSPAPIRLEGSSSPPPSQQQPQASVVRSASITTSTPRSQQQPQASVVRSASITTSTPRSQQPPQVVRALMGGQPIARSIVATPPKPIRKPLPLGK